MSDLQGAKRHILKVKGIGKLLDSGSRKLGITTSCSGASVKARISQAYGVPANCKLVCFERLTSGSGEDDDDDDMLDLDFDSVVNGIHQWLKNGEGLVTSSDTVLIDWVECTSRDAFGDCVTPLPPIPVLHTPCIPSTTNGHNRKKRVMKDWVQQLDSTWHVHIWR
jgi:hypothetical protein